MFLFYRIYFDFFHSKKREVVSDLAPMLWYSFGNVSVYFIVILYKISSKGHISIHIQIGVKTRQYLHDMVMILSSFQAVL